MAASAPAQLLAFPFSPAQKRPAEVQLDSTVAYFNNSHERYGGHTGHSFGSADRTFSSHISFTLLVRMIFRSSWTTTASSDYIGAPRITTGAAARELAPSRPVSKFTGSTTYSESFPAHEATAPYVQPQSEAYASGMPFEGTTTMEADFQGLPRITTGGAAQEVRHTQRACLQFRLCSRTPLSSLSSLLCASSSHRRDQR